MSAGFENITEKTAGIRNGVSISRGRKKTVFIIILVVLAVFIYRFAFAGDGIKAVRVERVERKDIVESLPVSGNIEAKLTDKYILSSSQKVLEVLVSEGQDVKAGTPLVRLDTSELDYQLYKAMISLNAALQNDNNSLKSLEDAVSQAEMNLDKANGDLSQAKRKLDANQELYNSGYISKDEYEGSVKSVQDLERQVKLMELQLQSAKRNLSSYDSSQIKQQISQYRADVDNLKKKIAESLITSKIDGRVVRMDAAAGEYPRQDKNVVMVCDLSSYKLVAGISQYDAVKLDAGKKVNVSIKGIDTPYDGVVSKIGEVAIVTVSSTSQDAKVNIEITINGAHRLIKPGYEADGDIILNEKKDVIAVSFDSIKEDKDGKYVFSVEDKKIVKKYITTSAETDFDVQVTWGLNEGDIYIPSPPDGLKEGDRVNII